MEIGLIGLGKMGGNMRERMRRAGHTVVGYDRNPDVTDVDILEGAGRQALAAPRVVWVMVPAGDPTAGDRRRARPSCSPPATWSSTAATPAGPTTSQARRAARGEGHRLRRLRRLRRRLGPGERLRADGRRRRRRRRQGAADLRRAQARGRVRLRARRRGRRRPLRQDGPQRHRVRHDAGLRRGLGAARGRRPGQQRPRGLPSWREGTVIRSWLLDLLVRALDDDEHLRAQRLRRRTPARAGGPSRPRSTTPCRCR